IARGIAIASAGRRELPARNPKRTAAAAFPLRADRNASSASSRKRDSEYIAAKKKAVGYSRRKRRASRPPFSPSRFRTSAAKRRPAAKKHGRETSCPAANASIEKSRRTPRTAIG